MVNQENSYLGIPLIDLSDVESNYIYSTTVLVVVNPGDKEHVFTSIDMRQVRVKFTFGEIQMINPSPVKKYYG